MTQVIDRRLNGKHKSAVNRQRFIQRFKKQIRKSIEEAINKRSITDVESGEEVVIPTQDTHEPIFRHDRKGIYESIHPGNKEFLPGDKLPRPKQGQGQGGGSQASNQGEGVDNFIFQINREELLDLFFDDLALPDLVKKQLAKIPSFETIRAGYTSTGIPANLNIIRSLKRSISRRTALGASLQRKIQNTKKQIKALDENEPEDKEKILTLKEEVKRLKRKQQGLPFIDTFDLRFNNKIQQMVPTTQAVMFCIMDVSGSMDKTKKYLAKRFFILLYLFLQRNYEKIDVVFIRHHTSAKEVDEEEFFYSRETGGTVVSSALYLAAKIIEERYDMNAWNIYTAQASDGDNWNADSPQCSEILIERIMPKMQYFAYVEILPRLHQSLWEAYLSVKEIYPNFAMKTINDMTDIYPVFRELFKKHAA
ncbi:MAG: YeaH/YhbH family protein [Pseudomonadota bacterium]